ncbi:gluconate 2-dehydrogenase subunit 3 family protein [Sphingomonas sp. BGYR3]|uniref:gluconate 2-dehydrogenase subunit 3 family protein n=1 Tax=Sphingomonas sp. BGYR3 TaxID=2975483 RepID=UPI0021A672D5|nr:gluconate 2-dehydrogenase subunit 3 family protein [Sphingomonas sp. BGYR3]MDG5488066.1 gluconate 2-dehydrogenase subunit 3 family protein [Sphingomonas sp. BGYR3]
MVDRRLVLGGLMASLGASVFAPLARAEAAGVLVGHAMPDTPVFNDAQRALLAELGERIIPTTDTPGAKAAEVHAYIEQLLAEWAMPDEAGLIKAGLDAVDAKSRADFGKPATAIDPAQLDGLLTQAMNGTLGDRAFFPALKQMVITGYYTSEIGVTVERSYLPVPGKYDGAYPYAEVGRVFSA